jgi:hypothetical protein
MHNARWLALLALVAGCAAPYRPTHDARFERSEVRDVAVVYSEVSGSEIDPAIGVVLSRLWVGKPAESTEKTLLRESIRNGVLYGLADSAPAFGAAIDPMPAALQGLDESDAEGLQEVADSVLVRTWRAVDALDTRLGTRTSTPFTAEVPPDFARVADTVGTPHLLLVRAAGWRSSPAGKLLQDITLSNTPRYGIGVEAVLVDADLGHVIWYASRGALLDPQDPDAVRAVAESVAFELFTGREVTPESFLPWPENRRVRVVRYAGKNRMARIVRRDGFDAVFRTGDDPEWRVPLANVKALQAPEGDVFPARPSDGH